MLPADGHVHSEWSWDAARGSMERTCRRAEEIGLPALAFTEHADFTPWRPPGAATELGERRVVAAAGRGDLDVEGYLAHLEGCRRAFPQLRILSGVELGEAHRFPREVAAVLAAGAFERVLGSVHCIPLDGRLVDLSTPGLLAGDDASDRVRAYFAEALAMLERAPVFAVLAHLTYPQRFWPHDRRVWSVADFEEELRAVLSAAVRAGIALEVNTTRGTDAVRGLCPGPEVVRWWHQLGGQAVSLGSDAHDPDSLAAGLPAAAAAIESAGFRRPDDPTGFWLR